MGLNKKLIIIGLLLFLALVGIVSAIEQKSYMDINLMQNNIYNVTWLNTSNLNASQMCLAGSCIAGWLFNTSAQTIMTINNTGIGAGNITLGTLANIRLDTKVYLINQTGSLDIGNISVSKDFNMNGKNITGVVNTTYTDTGGVPKAVIYWNGTGLITKVL